MPRDDVTRYGMKIGGDENKRWRYMVDCSKWLKVDSDENDCGSYVMQTLAVTAYQERFYVLMMGSFQRHGQISCFSIINDKYSREFFFFLLIFECCTIF